MTYEQQAVALLRQLAEQTSELPARTVSPSLAAALQRALSFLRDYDGG